MARWDGGVKTWYIILVLVVGVTAEMLRGRRSTSGPKVAVFLREQCSEAVNLTAVRLLANEFLLEGNYTEDVVNLEMEFIPKNRVCEETSQGLAALLEAMTDASMGALVGSIDAELCETALKLATLREKLFVTWSCPQSSAATSGSYSSFSSLLPSLLATAEALVRIVKHFRWKYAAILTTDAGWWAQLAHALDLQLREEGLVIRHYIVLHEPAASGDHLVSELQPLQAAPSRVIIMCLPLRSTFTDNVLMAIDALKLAHLPATTLLTIHLSSISPFLPARDLAATSNDSAASRSSSTNITPPIQGNPWSQVAFPSKSSTIPVPVLHTVEDTKTSFTHYREGTSFHSSAYTSKEANDISSTLPLLRSNDNLNSQPDISNANQKSSDSDQVKNSLDMIHNSYASVVNSKQTEAMGVHKRIIPRPQKTFKDIVGDSSATTMSYTLSDVYDHKNVHRSSRSQKETTGGNTGLSVSGTTDLSAKNQVTSPEPVTGGSHRRSLKSEVSSRESGRRQKSYVPPRGLGDAAKRALLVMSTSAAGADVEQMFAERLAGGGDGRGLLELDVVPREERINTGGGYGGSALLLVTPIYSVLEDWVKMKEKDSGTTHPDEEDALCDILEDGKCVTASMAGNTNLMLRGIHIVAIVICSALLVTALIVMGAIVRKQLLKKRMSKGPYKILLTPSDFVFPHVPDSLRVDEGIEAMLCCWLQQLQEFGGPEVDKPDLLKGSVGSLRSHQQVKSTGSTGSLTRNILVDPKARYNGDLVQLKELPAQGAFELKSKAMDVLVTLHGLRHENLNVLIGCLTDPGRPALVLEWCSRGSLEDVLVQDEIKLDWTFRLSLLTDLVRGMRYLHSSPIRVHGYLTSRNCVIDARWVLKVTDYGLPAFYEAQNISPPSRAARDLLWTAPELLRNEALRKRGTQPADVYSFGIVMQEVVVRGEPFCMLSHGPEEIIEKVKRPPPLIRPSVSKGAAPPEAINIMRQCWAEQADMRPDFNSVHDLFKKLNHGRKVNFVDTMFQMLEKYSNNLEELIRERTEQLDMEKKKTEQLLNRMLPSSVADKLKLGMPVDPEDFREVTIYFSDIVGFTTISAYSTPFEVVDLLNDLYTCFDATINAYNVYKVETIGDAYMVVGGLPVRIPDHADQIATMALDLLHQSGRFKINHLPSTPLRLRIGLHTGPCCAGVVGLTMPRYCLFGDTVNTASRMESTGSAWRIHLSQATKEQLDEVGDYQLEFRGDTELKGKGKMPTYWLLGKGGFNKELPMPPPLELDERMIRLSRGAPGLVPPAQFHAAQNNAGPANLQPTRSEDNSSGDCSMSFAMPSSDGVSPPKNASIAHIPFNVRASIHPYKEDSISSEDSKVLNKPFDLSSMKSAAKSEYDIGHRTHDNNHKEFAQHVAGTSVVKSASTDHQIGSCASAMGTPVSASEVAAALLGVSSASSLNNHLNFRASNFNNREQFLHSKHRRVGHIDEDDLSTPYNHYRCLSPSEQHLNHLHHNNHYIKSHHATSTSATPNRFLKRQFSLDRGDDPINILSMTSVSTMALDMSSTATRASSTGRLYKQNSAGAAHDLERIEEIPLVNTSGSPRRPGQNKTGNNYYRHRFELPPFLSSSVSVSVESLN